MGGGPIYSSVLPPLGEGQPARPGQPLVFPDPAASFVFVRIAPGEKVSSAMLVNCMGQALSSLPLPAAGGGNAMRFELPPSLPAGIYFIRLAHREGPPMTLRLLKMP